MYQWGEDTSAGGDPPCKEQRTTEQNLNKNNLIQTYVDYNTEFLDV